MPTPRRLLSIAHSYILGLNRRLAHELARAGGSRWEVTAVAPTAYAGRNDLRPLRFEPLPDEPCRVIPLPVHLSGRVHTFLYGGSIRRLLRARWDLVHCWQEPYIFAGGQVAWHTPRRTPLVFWTCQNIAKRYPPPFGWIERFCVRRCAGWMAIGQTGVEAMLGRGYGTKPHRLMPLGVDLDHFVADRAAGAAVRHELGWEEPGPPVIGFLGRLTPEKGVRLLTHVLDRLSIPWRALIVGAGPLGSEVRAWAAGHADRARVLTDVPHSAVPRYLNAMDLLCCPSQTLPNWREQQGRMIIEAWACRVPVIGSDSGEIPHVIADAGVVVGERDEAGWARAIADLLDSPDRRRDYAARGHAQTQTEYAWPVIARRHLAFFEELLDARPALTGGLPPPAGLVAGAVPGRHGE
jgi:glycosyltransferase involved in cell wall biosynthesis